MGAVTDSIQGTEELMDFISEKLKEYEDWNVSKHPGTGTSDLALMLQEVALPAAIVVYSSSSYGSKPRRNASFSVIVATEFAGAPGRVSSRVLLDKAISLLDGQVSGMALFRVVSDAPFSLGGNIAAYEIKFKVEDH